MRLMSNLSGPQTVSSIVCCKGALGSWDRGGAGRFRDPKERKGPPSEYQAFASDVMWICRWAKNTMWARGKGDTDIMSHRQKACLLQPTLRLANLLGLGNRR